MLAHDLGDPEDQDEEPDEYRHKRQDRPLAPESDGERGQQSQGQPAERRPGKEVYCSSIGAVVRFHARYFRHHPIRPSSRRRGPVNKLWGMC